MTATQVNALNIALMLLSVAAAFALPFQLFLFAYAVLGPLHYLTQISWLHSRSYFTTGRSDYLLIGALAVVLLALKYVVIDRMGQQSVLPWAAAVVLVSLAASCAMAFFESAAARTVAIVAALAAAPLVATAGTGQLLLLSLLPTIVHVYCFTAIFMLHGALRGRSRSGLLSFAVFAACTAVCLLWPAAASAPAPTAYVEGSYAVFTDLNVQLAALFGFGSFSDAGALYTSPAGVVVMRFIAFAYTYHYLNWFSKTSVIQWHKVPRAWSVANVVLWIGAVSLYAWDYASGVIVLFSLSWLHVLLELPLDFKTFGATGRELAALVTGPAARAAR